MFETSRKRPVQVGGLCRAASCARGSAGRCRQQQRQRAIRGMAGWVRWRRRRKPRSAVRPSCWQLCVRALAKQCFASKAPSPQGLGRGLLVCAFLRTGQDRGWASCPTRPRHASGPCRGHSRRRTHPPSTVSCDLSDLTAEFHSTSDRFHPRMACIYWPPAYCRRRGTVGLRGVSGMDAATKPHGWVYGVPANPQCLAIPRNVRCCCCIGRCLGLKQVQGCKPCRTPTYGRVGRCRAAAWRRRRFDYT